MTGASEGIGKGYAVEVCGICVWAYGNVYMTVWECAQLAKRGLNVVIMSRSEEKLQKVADEISKSHVHTPFKYSGTSK